MAANPLFPLELPISRSEVKIFNSFEEFRAWEGEQRKAFDWIASAAQRDGGLAPVHNAQLSPLDTAKTQMAKAERSANGGDHAGALTRIQNIVTHFNGAYRAASVVPMLSSDPLARAVQDEAAKDAITAGYMLGHLMGLSLPVQRPEMFRGVWRAEALRYGLSPSLESEMAAVRGFREQLRAEADSLSRLGQQVERDYANARRAGRNLATVLRRRTSKKLGEQAGEFRAFREASVEALRLLEETYDKRLALNAAVTYWAKKARRHLLNAIVASLATVLFVSAGVLAVGLEAVDLFERVAQASAPRLWQIGVVAVYATVLVYLMRLLVRVTMSQLHLYEDSSQRAVMTETYLALLREGKAVSDDDRRLVLEILFRHANTGLLKEDTSSPSPLEAIVARLTSRGAGS